MRIRRMITSILTILAVLLLCALPAVATASSLLSGYGGPGQGNQAILGSALLNGPSNRGGGGSAGGGGSTGAGTGEAAVTSRGGQEAGSLGAAGASTHRAAGPRTSAGTKANHASTGSTRAYPTPPALTRDTGGSPALGLSGKYVIFIMLALGALLLTAALTRQLTRQQPGQEGMGAKGMRGRTRGTD